MRLPNLRVKVKEVTADIVILETEQGERISLPRHLLEAAKQGEDLYVSVDAKPLVDSERHAKDVLNEIINPSAP